ncbi:DUF2206 domain-containing protein [uncultured Methanobacterium sp.]|uniref:DUF2206 domain-containing protein n=1 Tax=uncultured Methanobacterium sp. TaxID=176306 RepID=UPI002AA8F12B|nr:DUF2206 domain-containing protein [uncultured Methanobacterium sp.]
MQIDNFFQMNDWEMKKFLKVISILQLLFLGLIAMDVLGLKIPVLRELIPLIYLLIVPGILIIRILRMHKLGSVQTLLFTVGLSITSLMLLGFLLNQVGPLIGIANPISLIPLITTISLFVIILSVICYQKDKDYANPDYINSNELLSPPTLAVLLLPLLVIFGTYLMNSYGINILLVLFILILALIVILFAYDKIPRKLYPLIVFVMSVSILLHTSLISNYISGWDIQNEYYLANMVITNSHWVSEFNFVVNSMLSVTILPPILSIILKIDLNWIFKIIYPALYALVPLGLYNLFKKQTNYKIAFLSTFIFISFFAFYMEMISLARQEIGEIFLVLLLMVMISEEIDYLRRSILFIIFGVALALSHYGLAYFFMFSVMMVYILMWVMKYPKIQNFVNYFFNLIFKKKIKFYTKKDYTENKILNLTFVVFFFVCAMTWYMFTSASNAFNTLLYILFLMVKTGIAAIMDPSFVQSIAILQASYTPLHSLSKYINLFVQVLLMLGLLYLLLYNKFKIKKEYLTFMIVSAIILVGSLVLPYLSSAFNTERLYQIVLIFLAPAIVIGGLAFLKIIRKILNEKFNLEIKNFKDKSIKILSVFFIVYLLFNSGLIYSLANDDSNSIALNSSLDSPAYNDLENNGMIWITDHAANLTRNYKNPAPNALGDLVVADDYRAPILNKFGVYGASLSNSTNSSNLTVLNKNLTQQYPYKDNIYFFFGTNNILTNSFVLYKMVGVTNTGVDYVDAVYLFNNQSRIFDNGGSRIYIKSKTRK